MIRVLIRDVAGSAPYEKRLVELLKTGRDKRALKLAKRKVRKQCVYTIRACGYWCIRFLYRSVPWHLSWRLARPLNFEF